MANQTTKPQKPQAPTMSAEDRLTAILLAAVEVPDRGVPVLVGPTQWGKTYKLRHLFTQHLGIEPRNIVMFNPQNDLPEDIGGWPKRDGEWLSFTQPANIPPHLIDPANYDADGNPIVKWGIIVDEIDKSQEDTLSAMLTFFNPDERRLRSTYIKRSVPIVGAMNEPENRMIPEPLIARLLFLAYPPEGLSVVERPDLRALSKIAQELYGTIPEVKFPARPKAVGSLHKLKQWINVPIFWADEIARRQIVRGLFNEKDAAVVLGNLREQLPEPSEEWANSVNPSNMIRHLMGVLHAGDYENDVKVLRTIVNRARPEADPTREMERVFTAFLETPEALHAVHREGHMAEGMAALMRKIADMDEVKEQSKNPKPKKEQPAATGKK